MKTILITGCSSGFGLEIARHFLAQGWKVVATMRTPREDILAASEHLRVLALDVTDRTSILRAVEAAGPVDVLVNNAGIGLMGAFEGTTMDTVREVFETNTFGTLAMTQALLPQFRARRAGAIVNVSSSTTLLALPLLSVYTASKAAVNAFTESVALELAEFGIRVSLVLPGRSPETPFSRNAQARMQEAIPEAYAGFAERVFAGRAEGGPVTHAADVVQAVWRAATDAASPLRLPAGADAEALANTQR
ncbi:SDR family oxidoreductase [Massilia norwichensis]|uniref:SDR family oxidoreductase n=1 Tax=Massilia norwichensis TaxID=1442366 RepID=A0ABT2A5S1_9BURK|nr:SDR family oxidoreductase [Massilia norwichensis]MCS0589550.1 SDR family oxidoreductase [Massilia norwichensis]